MSAEEASGTDTNIAFAPPLSKLKAVVAPKRTKGSGPKSTVPVIEENEVNCPPGVKMVLKNVSLDIEQNSKIAILGKNGDICYLSKILLFSYICCQYYVGCGKSTLISLLMETSAGTTTAGLFAAAASSSPGGVAPSVVVTDGEVTRMSGFRVAYYQQNLADKLPYDKTALQYIMAIVGPECSEQLVRAHLGSFGLGGDLVLRQIGTLSGGQKSRIVLAQLTINK